MSNIRDSKSNNITEDDLLPEYNFDYRQGRRNRFIISQQDKVPVIVTLEPDVAEVFTTSKSVNQALRALLSAIPQEAINKSSEQ